MRALNLLSNYNSLAYPSTISTVTGAITVTITTGAVTGTTHKLVLGDTVVFDAANTPAGQTNAAPPAPLVAGVEYWVIPNSTTSFTLATSYANAVAGIYIVVTGTTVTTAAYTVNHYTLFANSNFANGLAPYLALEDSQSKAPVFQGAASVPIVCYTGVTAPTASPAVFTLALNASATIANGRAVKLGGNIPTGFVKNTVYYVVATSTDTFELAAIPGGAAINSTANPSTTGNPTTVYDVTGMQLGNLESSGEIGDVGVTPDVPFLEGYSSILRTAFTSLASNFTTTYIEGASDVTGTPDVPGAWTALATLNAAGAQGWPDIYLNIASLPQYLRARTNVLTDFGGGGSGGGTGIVLVSSATLLGN